MGSRRSAIAGPPSESRTVSKACDGSSRDCVSACKTGLTQKPVHLMGYNVYYVNYMEQRISMFVATKPTRLTESSDDK
jgi:hypothetical protein